MCATQLTRYSFIHRSCAKTTSPIGSSSQAHTYLSSYSAVKRAGIVGVPYLFGPAQKRSVVGKTYCAMGVSTHGENFAEYQPHLHAAEDKVGVLLLNLGGPETLHDVQPFLFNLFADPVCQFSVFQFFHHPLYCYYAFSLTFAF